MDLGFKTCARKIEGHDFRIGLAVIRRIDRSLGRHRYTARGGGKEEEWMV